jgi:hypothetical protein
MVIYEIILAAATLAGPMMAYGGYLMMTGVGMSDSLKQENKRVYGALLKQIAPKAKSWAGKVGAVPSEDELIPFMEDLASISKWSDLWREWNRHESYMQEKIQNVGLYLTLAGLIVGLSLTGVAFDDVNPALASASGLFGLYIGLFPSMFCAINIRRYVSCRSDIMRRAEDLNMGKSAFSDTDLED